jgi:ribosomal protein S18 acetylase RimI-like enzyme
MNNFIFCTYKEANFVEVIKLYENTGWTNYTNEPEILKNAISNSLFTLTAWKNDEMVGFIRAVGDGLTILYLQDIIVKDTFQCQGIGSELIKQTLENYKNVRQILLITDIEDKTISFYSKNGFKRTTDLNIAAFIKLKL